MSPMVFHRKSSGFSRGASIYRGVTRSHCLALKSYLFLFLTRISKLKLAKIYVNLFKFFRHHQHGRWQARIGRVAGNKDLYLGTFSK